MKNASLMKALPAAFVCALGLSAGTASAAIEDFNTYLSGPGLDIAIPDDDATGISDTITITDTGEIQRLVVIVSLEHTYVGDLTWTLTGPDDTSITLAEQPGSDVSPAGSSADLTPGAEGAIVFAEASPFPGESMGSGGCQLVGADCVRFFAPTDSFDVFVGSAITGDWTLTITDTQAFDTGTFDGWLLAAEIPAPPAVLLLGSALLGAMGVRRSAKAA